jgi:hypothetical protein
MCFAEIDLCANKKCSSQNGGCQDGQCFCNSGYIMISDIMCERKPGMTCNIFFNLLMQFGFKVCSETTQNNSADFYFKLRKTCCGAQTCDL